MKHGISASETCLPVHRHRKPRVGDAARIHGARAHCRCRGAPHARGADPGDRIAQAHHFSHPEASGPRRRRTARSARKALSGRRTDIRTGARRADAVATAARAARDPLAAGGGDRRDMQFHDARWDRCRLPGARRNLREHPAAHEDRLARSAPLHGERQAVVIRAATRPGAKAAGCRAAPALHTADDREHVGARGRAFQDPRKRRRYRYRRVPGGFSLPGRAGPRCAGADVRCRRRPRSGAPDDAQERLRIPPRHEKRGGRNRRNV